jgi:hypothetical protein
MEAPTRRKGKFARHIIFAFETALHRIADTGVISVTHPNYSLTVTTLLPTADHSRHSITRKKRVAGLLELGAVISRIPLVSTGGLVTMVQLLIDNEMLVLE